MSPYPKPLTVSSLTQIPALGFDTVIDVRSPAEYAQDHLPGAINLPVLSDAERAQVGTIYVQTSSFTARKIGAALVARNSARHLEEALIDKPGGWRPLVYCWRGGQRSGSFATILAAIGWRVEIVAGGYKAWRAQVVAQLDRALAAPVVVLDGNTGSAKTAVLARLAADGIQTIDLEALANHRGSLFGSMGGQPSQRAFEGRLAMALAALDPSRPVVIEAESSKVGNCRLPAALWKAMVAAPRVVIEAPLAARAAYLSRAYADLTADPARLCAVIEQLRPLHARAVIDDWLTLAREGDFPALAEDLMQRHYDPRYASHRARMPAALATASTETLDEAGIGALAAQITQAMARLT